MIYRVAGCLARPKVNVGGYVVFLTSGRHGSPSAPSGSPYTTRGLQRGTKARAEPSLLVLAFTRLEACLLH